jgi:tagatose-6-phosphate ketose/aldose isomerase
MVPGISEKELKLLGGQHTGNEIYGQPFLWKKLWKKSEGILESLKKFVDNAVKEKNLQIILTGAGTSAFIGNVLEGAIQVSTGIFTKSVATTDLVTHPELFFSNKVPVLLISFARSGDSPESAKAIELAELLSLKAFHIVITCNEESELTRQVKNNAEHFIYYMPEEANDKSLAMTGSFTTMLLAGLIISRINNLSQVEEQINLVSGYASLIFNKYNDDIKKIAAMNFSRTVFLGSGPFSGVAQESHLKLQELTDGKVICKHDTFLGFRHGPKAVVDENTLVILLFSNSAYVNRYELDMAHALEEGRKSLFTIGIMEKDMNLDLGLNIILSENGVKADEDFLSVVSVIPAQMLGFYKSLNLGLKPDQPSESGMIHRVVQGVNVYPYKNGTE